MTVTEIQNALAAQRQRVVELECCNVQEQLACEQILTANLAIEFQMVELETYGFDRDKDASRATG